MKTSLPLDRGEVDSLGSWRSTFDFETFLGQRIPWRGFLVTQAGLLGVVDDALWTLSVQDVPGNDPWLIGRTEDGVVHLAWEISTEDADAYPADFRPLTDVGATLGDEEALLGSQAVALARWHDRDRFCARCGAQVEVIEAGWASRCQECAAVEYPRTDPAVIVRITDERDRLLLAHNTAWQGNRMSLPAGFVEAGETPRRAVQREVFEEVGLRVTDIEYLGAQPWPGPRSLMLAYSARALFPSDLRPDGEEIDRARFFSRSEYEHAVAGGFVKVPAPTAIAHVVITQWLGRALPAVQD